MKAPLWKPSEERIKHANMTRFMEYVEEKEGKTFRTYTELYQWWVEAIPEFWARLWEFAGIKASRGFDQVVDDLRKFPGRSGFRGPDSILRKTSCAIGTTVWPLFFRGETEKSGHDDLRRTLRYRGPVGQIAAGHWGRSRETGLRPTCRT